MSFKIVPELFKNQIQKNRQMVAETTGILKTVICSESFLTEECFVGFEQKTAMKNLCSGW
jgi:hypothetical protein